MNRGIALFVPLMLAAVFQITRGQIPSTTDSTAVDVPVVVADSVEAGLELINSPETSAKRDTSLFVHPSKSPGRALLYSAILPGAGQAYNESYWKVPVVVGFGIYFASQWLDNNRRYHDYRDQFSESITSLLPMGNPQTLALREFYRDQRDTFAWYIAIYYFVNLIDAYVDASLYDFNVGGDLSIRLRPEGLRVLRLEIGL